MAKISLVQLERLCRSLAIGVDAGLDDRAIWRRESERGPTAHRARLSGVVRRLDRGEPVAESIASEAGDYFPGLFIEMVRMGERSGRQAAVFRRLADHYDHLVKLRRSFLQMITWPALELGAAIVVIGGLILLLGAIATWTRTEPIDLLGLGFSPIGNFTLFAVTVTMTLGGFALGIYGLLQGWFGPAPLAIAMRIPVLGQSLRLLGLSRFAWAFGMAIDSGMNAEASMKLGLASTQNAYYRSLEPQILDAIRRGEEFHRALRKTEAFPDDLIDVLETGELTGTITESLERLSDDYQERSANLFRTLTVVGGFLVMGMVGVAIAAAVIMLYKRLIIDQYNQLLEM